MDSMTLLPSLYMKTMDSLHLLPSLHMLSTLKRCRRPSGWPNIAT